MRVFVSFIGADREAKNDQSPARRDHYLKDFSDKLVSRLYNDTIEQSVRAFLVETCGTGRCPAE